LLVVLWEYFINMSEEKGKMTPLTLSDAQRVAILNKFPCQGVRLGKPFRFLPASVIKGKANISLIL
jgi:hypothetical protein